MNDLIDAEELPFTRQEVFLAGCRFLDREEAAQLADHLAECGPDLVAVRAERRVTWAAAGMPNASSAFLHAWHYPDELLPALASLSEDSEQRALRVLEAQWEIMERSLVKTAQHRIANKSDLTFDIPDSVQDPGRAVDPVDGVLNEQTGMATYTALTPLPPAMTVEISAQIEATRAEWRAAVNRFRAAE